MVESGKSRGKIGPWGRWGKRVRGSMREGRGGKNWKSRGRVIYVKWG